MKKILITFLILIILSSFMLTKGIASYAADGIDLNAAIERQAIEQPLSLPIWYPPYYIFPVAAIKHINILRSIIAPAATGTGLLAKQKQKDNLSKSSDDDFEMAPINNDINNNLINEEILYNIDFKNSPQTPIYSDTITLIKIPDWLKYSENSVKFNNTKLTDEEDKDRLAYLPKDKVLKISLKNFNANNKITITFNAKPLVYNATENGPYCLIKFQSKSRNLEMNWKPFSVVQK